MTSLKLVNEHGHAVQFYSKQSFLAAVVADYIVEGLRMREPAVVIATPAHRRAVFAQLGRKGIDVRSSSRNGMLTVLDARETLATFMRGRMPDPEAFQRNIEAWVEKSLLASESGTLRAHGQMVNLLWRDGNGEAALRLEEMWNELASRHNFSMLCGYAIDDFSSASDLLRFKSICGAHTHVLPTEDYLDHDDHGRLIEISLLQQRAVALDTEAKHRLTLEQELRDMVCQLIDLRRERDSLVERERVAREEAERAWADAQNTRIAAEVANRVKSEFLAVMSHELRTPLNAIGGYAELMELGVHGPVSKSQRETLERIQKSQRHLLGLINQVLNYARIESGSLRYDIQDVGLDEILRTAEALILPKVRAKGLRYLYSGCDSTVAVRVDSEKLQQIVLNLLANAIKFTDRGGSVGLRTIVKNKTVQVRVSDSGIGIPRDRIPTIFEPFVQIDSNYTRTRDGIGLGLAISRDLARGMSADLTVESEERNGSTFTLELPRVY